MLNRVKVSFNYQAIQFSNLSRKFTFSLSYCEAARLVVRWHANFQGT